MEALFDIRSWLVAILWVPVLVQVVPVLSKKSKSRKRTVVL